MYDMSKVLISELTHSQRVRILYKAILRLHRGLPEELRVVGDNYARDEFRRHLKCSPMEAQVFMSEWANYAVTISTQLGLRGKPKDKLGEELDSSTITGFSDDQTVQLYELMLAAKGLTDDVKAK